MCGICGILDFKRAPVDPDLIRRMTDIMKHRGPDDAGHYFDEGISLGHRRLSIIDIAGGHQPLCNEDKTVWVVYNGEIYNYKELRNDLRKKGHVFAGNTDTEVIVHAYETYKEECVSHFRGQFALAVWDTQARTLFLARDRLGIKPLYYATCANRFIFSSEIKSLLLAGHTPSIDIEALNKYLALGYVWGKQTLFAGIQKLEPGSCLHINDQGNARHSRYWDSSSIAFGQEGSFKDYSEKTASVLHKATSLRLISDVPLGAFLSGGLDSSIMVALMGKASPDPVETFSVVFSDDEYDESPYSSLVARHFNTRHHILKGEDSVSEILENVVWHLDEPLPDCATIPTYTMSRLTRQFVKVVLSGDGSDEIFAGYNKYLLLHYMNRIHNSPFRLANRLFEHRLKLKLNPNRHIPGAINDPCTAYLSLLSSFSPHERTEIISSPGNVINNEKTIFETIDRKLPALTQLQLIDLLGWLPSDILLKVDKMGMAWGLETRLPFLDHLLVELAFSMPHRFKLNLLSGKHILKKTFSDYLPQKITKKKKHGFNFPFEQLISQQYVDTLFKESSLYQLINKQKTMEIIKNRYSQPLYGNQFRTLFFLFLWNKIFVEEFERSGRKNKKSQ
ncbi:MAG: asparagine synthase (glutamine-hydrolyzing) [Chitinivibrionales bacterium]|nr:asparagine synthase (glutamine-hydrolyzing) [Chitinivibrionales bacterium]